MKKSFKMSSIQTGKNDVQLIADELFEAKIDGR
jgi:hypothetical protein